MKAVIHNSEGARRFIEGNAVDLDREPGRPWLLVLKPYKPPRSLEQNAYLHCLIRELADHTGYTESQMKDIVKSELGIIDVYNLGSRLVDAPRSTTDYNKEEMMNMIERVLQLGAEVGCTFQTEAPL